MSHDLLAGLLPAGNPLAPFDAAALLDAPDQATPPELDTIPEVAGDSAIALDSEPEAAAELELLPDDDEEVPTLEIAQDAEVPAITPIPELSQGRGVPRGGRGAAAIVGRRRRSRNAPLILGMGLAVCAGIGVCVFLLVSGFGISQHGELVSTRTERNEEPAAANPANPIPANPAPANPGPANPAPGVTGPQRDPVMGGMLAPPQTPQPQPAQPEPTQPEPAQPEPVPEALANRAEMPKPVPAIPAPSEDPPMETPTTEEPATAAAPMENPPPAAPASSPLEPAIDAIRSGRYDEMLAAAEQAQQAATTPGQRELAAGMHLLAELADHYVEGIRRGAAGLGAAETFEIVPEMPVIVVESSRESVVLKINGRVKSYPFESMPLVLAHRLTEFSLPADDPVAKAAAGAYQAVWPQATDAHRRQAFEWWRNLDGEAAGADFSQLEPTVREIFGMSDS